MRAVASISTRHRQNLGGTLIGIGLIIAVWWICLQCSTLSQLRQWVMGQFDGFDLVAIA